MPKKSLQRLADLINVSELLFTTASAKEKIFALNFIVIFGPAPALGKNGAICVVVRWVSSQDEGPWGKTSPPPKSYVPLDMSP